MLTSPTFLRIAHLTGLGFVFLQMEEKDFFGFPCFICFDTVWMIPEDPWNKGMTEAERWAWINCSVYCTGRLKAPAKFRILLMAQLRLCHERCHLKLNMIAKDTDYSLFTKRGLRPEALQKHLLSATLLNLLFQRLPSCEFFTSVLLSM